MSNVIVVNDIPELCIGYPCPVEINGMSYANIEEAFDAMAISDEYKQEQAMTCLMRTKFSNPDFAYVLLDTDEATLVYEGDDDWWTNGTYGDGSNMLGEILMIIRDELALFDDNSQKREEDEDCEEDDSDDWCADQEDDSDDEDEDEKDPPPTLFEALRNNPDDDLLELSDTVYHNLKIVFEKFDEMQDLFGRQDDIELIVSRVGEHRRHQVTQYVRALQACRNALHDMDALLSSEV